MEKGNRPEESPRENDATNVNPFQAPAAAERPGPSRLRILLSWSAIVALSFVAGVVAFGCVCTAGGLLTYQSGAASDVVLTVIMCLAVLAGFGAIAFTGSTLTRFRKRFLAQREDSAE